jgi:hypothetical protein
VPAPLRVVLASALTLPALAAVALASPGSAADVVVSPPAATDDVYVMRVGTPDTGLSHLSAPVVLERRNSTTGDLVSTISMPAEPTAEAHRLVLTGSYAEGSLSRSADGRYVSLAGYDARPGLSSVASDDRVARVVAQVDGLGSLDTSTVVGPFQRRAVYTAASLDGSSFWMGGTGLSLRRVPYESGPASEVSPSTPDAVAVVPAGGRLWFSTQDGESSGVYSVEDTATGTQASSLVAEVGSPSGVVALDLDATVPGVDTLYVSDTTADTGGIRKFSFDGTTWTARGSYRPHGESALGLAGAVGSDGTVTLVATTAPTLADRAGGSLVRVTDTAGHDEPIAATDRLLATAPAGTHGYAGSPSSPDPRPPGSAPSPGPRPSTPAPRRPWRSRRAPPRRASGTAARRATPATRSSAPPGPR